MANPNIVNVTDIRGKTVVASLTTTSSTLVVENVAASGKVFKINSLIVSNVDGSSAADITIICFLRTTLVAQEHNLLAPCLSLRIHRWL
jgi:hypothetical protein